MAASVETSGVAINWRNLVETYPATIDTSAWVLLLLLFEERQTMPCLAGLSMSDFR